MGYSNSIQVDMILGQALTAARAENAEFGVQLKLWEVGHVRDTNIIPNDIVNYYISLGDNQIDGILSQQYYTPLRKCVQGQWDLDADINEYNQTIEISDTSALNPGDDVIIKNLNNGDEYEDVVLEVVDQHSFSVIGPITIFFEGDNIVVKRIQYPAPINQISARYAAAFIYDKYFSAQNSPNVSDYGNKMREICIGQLNDILNGRVILKNQMRVGDHWGGPWNEDTYALRDRGFSSSERNMSGGK